MQCTEKTSEDLIKEIEKLRLLVSDLRVSEREQDIAMRVLIKESAQYRFLIENAQDMIFTIDEYGRIASLNPAFETQTGWHAGDLLYKPFTNLVHQEDRDNALSRFSAIFEGRSVSSVELRIPKKGGGEIMAEVTGIPLVKNGRVWNLLGIARNVTEFVNTRHRLREAEANYKSIVDNALVGVFKTSLSGDILFVNKTALDIFEFDSAEHVLRNEKITFRYKNPRERDNFIERLKKTGKINNHEIRMTTKTGKLRDVMISATLQGEIISGMMIDVTEHRYREMKDHLIQAVLLDAGEAENAKKAIASALNNVCRFTKWPYAESWMPDEHGTFLIYEASSDRCKEGLKGFVSKSRKVTFQKNSGLPGMVWQSKRPIWIKDISSESPSLFPRAEIAKKHGLKAAFGVPVIILGGVVAAVLVFAMSEEGEEDADLMEIVSAVARQLTHVIERKKAEEELDASYRRFRSLSAHLQSARENERKRIAREIHDDLGQSLTALGMDIEWIKRKLPRGDAELSRKVDAMSSVVSGLINTVRSVSSGLRPPLLDDFGIAAAMEWHINEFQGRYGIRCRSNFTVGGKTIDKGVSITIYRILQEALTNVARHSGATRVNISLKKKAGSLALTIADNGCGIPDGRINGHESLGLIGMRERAEFLGGNVKITSKKGEGAKVEVTIPAGCRRVPYA